MPLPEFESDSLSVYSVVDQPILKIELGRRMDFPPALKGTHNGSNVLIQQW
jgi:hypothetical protein